MICAHTHLEQQVVAALIPVAAPFLHQVMRVMFDGAGRVWGGCSSWSLLGGCPRGLGCR